MAVRTVLAIQTLFLVVLSEPESLQDMSGGCVGEAIELGASGSRTGRAVISRSKRFRQSISELRLSFFERAWVFELS
jgi:hypothetical protein